MKETTAQDKAVIFWFGTSTVGLFCFQVYAIFNSASSFGASLWMAGIIAGISAVTPDAFAWIANLLNYTGWRKWVAIGVGVSISTAIGAVFSTMMTAEMPLIAIYMLVQLAMIAVQVLTADVAIEALFNMPPAIVRQFDKQNKEREQVIAVVDANIDSVKDQINDAVSIIIDAIPQPAPVDFAPIVDNQAEMFGGVRDLALLVKTQGERIEELNEAVRGLKANKPVVVSTIVDPKKLRTAEQRTNFVRTYPWADPKKLSQMWDVSAKHITTKYLNGTGK